MVNRRELFALSAAAPLLGSQGRAFDSEFGTARQAAEAIASRKVSSVELTTSAFRRIDKYNPSINAFVYQMREEALAAARSADQALARGRRLGPLHGVPVSVKECFGIQGRPATFGVPQLKDAKAARTAVAVQRLADAGAVVLGATNVPINLWDWQSVNPIYGLTRNPWNLERTPGGSSGGSSAALAAGLGYLSLGGDLGGSLRIPAHFCGIYAHKPTVEVVSRTGMAPGGRWNPPGQSSGLDAMGPMARSAEDLMDAMGVLGGAEGDAGKAWTWRMAPPRKTSLEQFRVGYLFDDRFTPVSSEQQPAFEAVRAALGKAGVAAEAGWPEGFDPMPSLMNYGFLVGALMEGFFPPQIIAEMKKSESPITAGMGATHARWEEQNMMRLRTRMVWQKYFESHDVFVCPVALVPAFPHDTAPMEARKLETPEGARPYMALVSWVHMASVAGLPATVMPIGKTASGLPIGLQIIGPMWEDATPIQFAALLSQRMGGFQAPPGYRS